MFHAPETDVSSSTIQQRAGLSLVVETSPAKIVQPERFSVSSCRSPPAARRRATTPKYYPDSFFPTVLARPDKIS